MSILNVWIERDSALLGVDSEMTLPDGRRLPVAKLMPLANINAVVGARGHLGMLLSFYVQCVLSGMDFDSLIEKSTAFLAPAFSEMIRALPLLGLEDSSALDAQTIVLVGWSPREDRILGMEFEQTDRQKGFAVNGINPYHIAPWDSALSALPDPRNLAALQTLYSAQTTLLREKAPAAAAGGRLVTCSIDRKGLVITS